jgi:UDP-glucose 4-epimerase
VYNVGSGRSRSVIEIVNEVLQVNNLSFEIVEEQLQEDPNKADIKDSYADIFKLENLKQDNEFSGLT